MPYITLTPELLMIESGLLRVKKQVFTRAEACSGSFNSTIVSDVVVSLIKRADVVLP